MNFDISSPQSSSSSYSSVQRSSSESHVSTRASHMGGHRISTNKRTYQSNVIEIEKLRAIINDVSPKINALARKIDDKTNKLGELAHTYNTSSGENVFKKLARKTISNLKSSEKLPKKFKTAVDKTDRRFSTKFPTDELIEKKQNKIDLLKQQKTELENELSPLMEKMTQLELENRSLHEHKQASLEQVADKVLKVTVTPVKPTKDLVYEDDNYDFKDEQGNVKAAIGLCETTPPEDSTRLKVDGTIVFHTDDCISYSEFVDGKGAVLVNTDGEGGKESSDLYSNVLNQAYQKAVVYYHEPLTQASLDNDKQQAKLILDQIASQATLETFDKFKAAAAGDKSIKNGGSTLGTVISCPHADSSKVNIMGTYNYDTAIVVWNNEKMRFDYHVKPYGKNLDQTQSNWGEYKEFIDAKPNYSPHFFQTVSKGTLVGVLTDGVLDNLPSPTLNELKRDPQKLKELELDKSKRDTVFKAIMSEKFEALAQIINNPFFDHPTDPPTSLEFTMEDLPRSDTKEEEIRLTPDIARNRLMNYTRWASQSLRELQSTTMVAEPIIMKAFMGGITIPKGMEVSDEIFKSLGSKAGEHFTTTEDGKHIANFQHTISFKFFTQDDLNKFPEQIRATLTPHLTDYRHLERLTADITDKLLKENAEKIAEKPELEEDYRNYNDMGFIHREFNKKHGNDASIQNTFIIADLFPRELIQPIEVTTKTDGVSCGFMRV